MIQFTASLGLQEDRRFSRQLAMTVPYWINESIRVENEVTRQLDPQAAQRMETHGEPGSVMRAPE